jgi:NADPH:quinone reductase
MNLNSNAPGPNRSTFAEQVRELTGGVGVAAVYDGVSASTFDGSLASTRGRRTTASAAFRLVRCG